MEWLVTQYRTEIVRCIKEPKIVSLLETTLLSEDVAKALRSECQQNPTKWVDKLLDIVKEIQEPGKWTTFLQALKRADYPYLVRLLNEESVDQDHSYIKKIGIHRDRLEKGLSITDVLTPLSKHNVINGVDRQEIEKQDDNKGNHHAVSMLLDRMQCRLAPKEWYHVFLNVLLEQNKDFLLEDLEPEFWECPEKYMARKAQSTGPPTGMDIEEEGACGSSENEHIMTAYGEAEMSLNNLDQSPQVPTSIEPLETTSSVCSQTTEKKFSNIDDNLASSLNIKPEMSKLLIEEDSSMTNVKVKEEVQADKSDNDDDSNPLLSDCEVDDVIPSIKDELRNYQLELAENAVSGKNTVVCAPTGTGKTWVALYIIQEHLRSFKPGEGKIVFMARTGALIKQQYDRIRKHLPMFQTKLLQGDGGESQMLGEFLQDYQIFCFTPQILVNNLESGSVESISKISLIILDECHHTKKDSPYSTLMKLYLLEKYKVNRDTKLPQIVGLTATLGVGKSSTVIDALDYIYHILALMDVTELSIVRDNKAEMLKETSEPTEETIPMQARQNDVGIGILEKAIDNVEEMLEEMALMQSSLVDLMMACPPKKESQEYNKWTHEIMKAAQRNIDDYNMSRNIYSCASYLNIYNQALEVNSLLQTQDVIKFLAEKHCYETEQKEKLTIEERKLVEALINVQKSLSKEARRHENPNVRLLSQRLRAMLQDGGEESRAMVFVKARATCMALTTFLKKDLKDVVRIHALYGKENRGNEEGMTQAVQDETVQKFRDGIYNVLVATSIGIEGIDIPECNMALNYNYIGNEITKVQMRGRIRKRGGTNLTFVHEKDLDKERMSAYKEAMMLKAMELFEKERTTDIKRKTELYQKEEIQNVRFKKRVEMAKKLRKTDEGDFEIRCRRCNTLACYASDIRTIKVQHIVIDREFANKIITKPHKKPVKFDGFVKDRKMFCKKCPLDWGIVAEKDGLDCRILKLENFKFVNMTDREVTTYRKWIDVPYRIREIDADDLPRLLGNDYSDN